MSRDDGSAFYFILEVQSATTTHALLTGGKGFIDDNRIDEFRRRYAAHLKQGTNGMVPSVSEQHTLIFPMYVDVDLCAPVSSLSEECIRTLATIMTEQAKKFYASPESTKQFVCIVCTKTGTAPLTDAGTYKHGLHLHWPNLRVRIEQAKQIRCSMVHGLNEDVHNEDWQRMLGHKKVDWDEVLDRSVYSNGLRMIGAPKAKKCPECKASVSVKYCSTCKLSPHRGYLMDTNVYQLGMVLTDGLLDEARFERLNKNAVKLIKETSVRCLQGQDVTPGYAVYKNCPPDVSSPSRGRKRKSTTQDDTKRLAPAFRRAEEVTDPRKFVVFRTLLLRHSPAYRNASLTAKYEDKSRTYKVMLTGEGATYCLNKQAEHKSNRSYMTVRRDRNGSTAECFMTCFCPCNTVRSGNVLCKNFVSARKTLSPEEVKILFNNGVQSSSASLSSLACRAVSDLSAHSKWDDPSLAAYLEKVNANAGKGV